MNPRALDLVIRSVTTSLLAFTVLVIAAYQVIHTGEVDTSVGAFVGLVLGFYFGAHVSQNGASSRSRQDVVAAAQAMGEAPPPDALGSVRANA